jgi:hypothetical protein
VAGSRPDMSQADTGTSPDTGTVARLAVFPASFRVCPEYPKIRS